MNSPNVTTSCKPHWTRNVLRPAFAKLRRMLASVTCSVLSRASKRGLMALSILTIASCAAIPSVPQTADEGSCLNPKSDLQPVEEPPMQDATNLELGEEAGLLRTALREANRRILKSANLLDLQDQQRLKRSSNASKP